MAQSLFEHGQIRTTLTKAKDLRPFVERLITLARKARNGSLSARQRLTAVMGDRAIIPTDYQEQYEGMSDAARNRVLRSRSGRRYRLGQAKGGQQFTAKSVVHHLINDIAGDYDDRPGGYTRVIKLGRVNKGDSSPMAILQLVGYEESPGTVTRPETSTRKRRIQRRYAVAAEAIKKQRGRAVEQKAETDADAAETEVVAEQEESAAQTDETAGDDEAADEPSA
jgi:large subunit ribosomal protein L17